MDLSYLIRHSALLESTKCGIHSTLLKFRPDLKAAMDEIPGRDVNYSVQFLKDNGMWDKEAEAYLDNFMRWLHERRKGPDEYTNAKVSEWQDKLMCHVAQLIRRSVSASR